MADFGVRLPAGGPLAGPRPMALAARRAEELGYDAVWVHDFIVWTRLQDQTHVSCGSVEAVERAGDAPPMFYESLTNLAWLAGITERVRLGVAVLCIPFREPIATAKQIANIDLLSEGRLILGIGVGGAKSGNNQDFEVLGIPRGDKWSRTIDYVHAMQEIWSDEKPSYEGRFVSFPETDINPKPVQKPHPPLWGSGRMDKSMQVTAELCTGWLPSWIPPEEYPERIDALHGMAHAAGRDVDWRIGDEIYACVAPTSEAAHAMADRTIGVLTHGFGSNPPVELIQAASLVGSPDEISEKLRQFIEGGVTDFEIKFVYHEVTDLLDQFQLFAEAVAPEFTKPEVPDGADAVR